ncbi:hypothetical protein B4110_3062 [Parageobacillus toebii]|uniref:Uncharacterized protein n=1 Tax=Parageobacillus toebii TaxID=153151 RepID=A0A150N046_9BACL|nr:hypothetical protein B4110_3062 [Parageobacillus toebii]
MWQNNNNFSESIDKGDIMANEVSELTFLKKTVTMKNSRKVRKR